MARQFLTGINLSKNELQNAAIQNLSTASRPSSPASGQIYFDTDTNQLTVWDGTAWVALAAGGNVSDAIQSAIDALDTDDIEEGSSNLYYTTGRAKTDAAALLTGAIKTNITITGDGDGLTITAENGVADSTTTDLTEGTNLYFTTERAQDAVGEAVGNGLTYTDSTGAIAVDISGSSDVVGTTDSQTLTNKTLGSGTVLSASVDANQNTITDLPTPSADSDAATKGYVDTGISTHASDTSTHGVGEIVGTTETQTLTNKTLGSGTSLSASLDADDNRITNVAAPTDPADAANKAYVDNAVAGLTWKAGVNLLAASNVPLTGSTGLVIDGHAALDTNDDGYRILLTAQSTDSQNGIYVYNDDGTNYTLTRAADADVYTELIHATVFIQEGTTYGQSAWTQANGYLTDFTSQDWVQFSGAAQITAGAGLTKTGNTLDVVGTADRITANADSIDIASTYVGQSSITTLGTITTGVWNGTDIAVADGGTGASTAADARANLGATTKYTAANGALTASGGVVTWTVTHNLGIRTVVVQVYDITTFEQVEVDVVRTNTNVVTLSWSSASDVLADKYQVVVIG